MHLCSNAVYERIQLLDDLVDVNIGTFLHHKGIKLQATHALLHSRCHSTSSIMSMGSLLLNLLDEYFDTYSVIPSEFVMNFFVAMEDEETFVSIDYFHLCGLCMPTTFIDCIRIDEELLRQETSAYATLHEANGPRTIRQRGLFDQTRTILATDPHALVSISSLKHAVIFYTGASLGITNDKNNFDGPITIPEGDLCLVGGMAQDLKIEGIGAVTWTFRNVDGSDLTICSQCYYVPNARFVC